MCSVYSIGPFSFLLSILLPALWAYSVVACARCRCACFIWPLQLLVPQLLRPFHTYYLPHRSLARAVASRRIYRTLSCNHNCTLTHTPAWNAPLATCALTWNKFDNNRRSLSIFQVNAE